MCVWHTCIPTAPSRSSTTSRSSETISIEVDEAGTKTVSPGEECYPDGRPNNERRVQVLAERDTDLEFVFFESTVTLDGQSTARFERAA